VSRRGIRKNIFENFNFRGHLPPKSEIENRPQTHSEQATGHGMHCREILFTPRCSPRTRKFPISGQLFSTTYSCGATGRQIAQFSYFGLFSPYKTPKTYLPVISLQPRGYIAEWFRFFLVIIEGPKGVPSGTGDFLRLLVGELGTPKLAQIFNSFMANGYIHTECNCTARQIWTEDVWKRAILRTDVLSL